jgi:hypothetical protein
VHQQRPSWATDKSFFSAAGSKSRATQRKQAISHQAVVGSSYFVVGLTRIVEGRIHEADDRGLRAVVWGRKLEHVVWVGHNVIDGPNPFEGFYSRLDERRPLGIIPELVDEGLDVGTRALVGLLRLETKGGGCCSKGLSTL